MSHQENKQDNFDLTEWMTPRMARKLEKKRKKQLEGSKQISQEREAYSRPIKTLTAKTPNQQLLINAIHEKDQVICFGPAGTGKTFIISSIAAQLYLKKKIKKIVVTRPNIAAGKSLGFFPGDVNEKMAVWVQPVIQILKKYLGQGVYDIALKNGDIILQPLETIRGQSYSDSFIIVDEVQNISEDEVKALLTRVGENSKIVLNGDILQKDLTTNSGLDLIIQKIKNNPKLMSMSELIELDFDDIVRSELCKEWVKEFYLHDNPLNSDWVTPATSDWDEMPSYRKKRFA